MRLVERGRELSALAELFSGCAQGQGQIALVSGPVASGKTALLHRFAEPVTSSGALFLSATASRSERTLPFGLISQIARSPELSGGTVELTVPQLLDDGPLDPSVGDVEPGRIEQLSMSITHRIFRMVHDLARHTPVVIGIDDVQHADEPSLAILLYLLRRSKTARVLFVLNECSCPQDRRPLLHAELHAQPHCHRIRLEPLSGAGVEQLAGQYLDPSAAQQLAPAFHRITGGNPLLVKALIEDTQAVPAAPLVAEATGETFAQAVAACLYRCDPLMSQVARAVAVLDGAAPRALLGEVVDSDADSIERSFRALEAVGLLHDGRFRHEAARAAALSGVPAHELAELHDRIARVLHDNGAAPRRVARHLVEASGLDAPWMVTTLQDAADQEVRHGDLSLAVRYLRLARLACTDDRQRAQVTAALAATEWQLDPAMLLRLLPELTKAAYQGHLSGRHNIVKLVTYLFWHGYAAQALELTNRMRLDAPQSADPEQANAKLLLSWLYPPLLRPERDCASTPNQPPHSRELSLVNAVLDGQEVDDSLLIAAEQVLLGARLDDAVLSPIMASLAALVYTDSLDRAASWCGPLLKAAEKRGARTWHALFSTVHSIIDVRRGALREAGEHARRALTLLPPQSWGVAIGLPLASMVQTATEMGDYQEAQSFLDVPVPSEMYQTLCALYYIRARGRYHVAIGHLHTALADFQSCGKLMRDWGVDQPALIPWRGDAARACLGLGLSSQARQLVHEQFSMTAPTDHRTRGASLRVMAQLSEAVEREALLTAAVTALERSGDRVELAAALADLSRAHSARGEHQQAQQVARRVDLLAGQSGAEASRRALPPEVVHADLRLPAQPTEPRAELSDAEHRVAALAAEGYTNRQIANELYITISTVEQHLTRVYRKLRVNRRIDLSAALSSC
jgi:DNA-binding NarL/FixJ family response regulator